jgi:hypothetical protein
MRVCSVPDILTEKCTLQITTAPIDEQAGCGPPSHFVSDQCNWNGRHYGAREGESSSERCLMIEMLAPSQSVCKNSLLDMVNLGPASAGLLFGGTNDPASTVALMVAVQAAIVRSHVAPN